MSPSVAEALTDFSAFTEPRDGLADNPFKLQCSLSSPATAAEVKAAWPEAPPPAELAEAWSVSATSRLFEDAEYGQWGLVLLSPGASAERTAEQRSQRPGAYRADDVVIGEFLGDLDLLVMAPSENGTRRILIALPLDDRQAWYPAASSLAEFLRRYLTSCGSKYWEPAG
jgi:hypothetical protein